MVPEKSLLREYGDGDRHRAGWYLNDLFYCVCCEKGEGGLVTRIPRGEPVYYAGVGGLFYCVEHAPTDALGAPALVREA